MFTQVGHSYSDHYTIDGTSIPRLQEHNDLGILISHDLETTTHCNAAAAKGYRALRLLRRPFKCFDEEMFRILYPTYVGLCLKYCVQATSPCLIKDTNSLEGVRHVGIK